MENVDNQKSVNIEDLEDYKLKEIEHSRKRRSILKGYERHIDTEKSEQAENKDLLILDKDEFEHNFSNMKYYSITNKSEEYQHQWMKRECTKGTRLLDFGCGNGENGIYGAKCGSEVVGIDISPEGVENANHNAKEANVDNHCKFKVMDAENMTFPENSFDLAVEYGALHHMNLEKAMTELKRVLKPEGKMICIEALKHNPIIHRYRKKTPHLRTEWEVEHILGVESLDIIKKYFNKVQVNFFHLAVLAAVPFRKTFLFKPLRSILNLMDRLLLKFKFIGKYAWIMVITLENPKK